MPRIARQAAEGPFHHVIVQGIDREKIFGSALFKSTYLKILSTFKQEYGVAIITFCIMDNHAHLLLHSPSIEQLSGFMHRVNTRYAGTYNKLKDRVGYVFRNRYTNQSVSDDSYAINCMVYIHNNPVKAGVVQNAADYTHSGLRCYLEGSGIVDFDIAAELFDIDAENVEAIMAEKSAAADEYCPIWLDTKEDTPRHEETAKAIVSRLTDKPALLRHDKELLLQAVDQMRAAGISLSEIARHLSISRTTLYYLTHPTV